ncbi:MAG: bifunctional folylpolyglutamate synthase/dihydrofolate synthase [Lachnospiraceae bacterium]
MMTVQKMRQFLDETGRSGLVLGMESMERLCERLGNPQNQGKIIHIAGTNGKGSTGAFLEQALLALGYKVGRYTSPAVFCYEEIYKINDIPVMPERLAQVMEQVKNTCDGMVADGFFHPTRFEVETAAAFLYFAEEQCDFTLIEVGMGGKTDATNVIAKPVISVITSISMDHREFLGDTLPKIAEMKAGIIKPGCPVVALKQSEEVNRVLIRQVKEENHVVMAGQSCEGNAGAGMSENLLVWADPKTFPMKDMTLHSMTVELPGYGYTTVSVSGACQQENLACAFTVLQVLSNHGYLDLKAGFETVRRAWENMTWPGRFEIICKKPLCIMDGCHNPDAADKLARTIEQLLEGYHIRFVIGVLGDKDYEGIFSRVLPKGERAYCITPHNARGLDKAVLGKVAARYLSEVVCCDTVEEAMKNALDSCTGEKDMVLVFGSLSYLGEVKQYVNGICGSPDPE